MARASTASDANVCLPSRSIPFTTCLLRISLMYISGQMVCSRLTVCRSRTAIGGGSMITPRMFRNESIGLPVIHREGSFVPYHRCLSAFSQAFHRAGMFYITSIDARTAVVSSTDIRIHHLFTGCSGLSAFCIALYWRSAIKKYDHLIICYDNLLHANVSMITTVVVD